MKRVVLVGSKSEGWGAWATAVGLAVAFLAVAKDTRIGRLERK